MRREFRMKKLSIVALAALLVIAMTIPAAALENEFGGYWRTRIFSQYDFTGEDETEARDLQQWDTRTRLYYTAKLSPNLKFVNKFEFDSVWGGPSDSYGDISADGIKVEIKNSYVDFKLAQHRFEFGVQDFLLAKGYLFDDDAAGIKAIFKASDAIYLPLIYIKGNEGGIGKSNDESNDDKDVDAFIFYPTIYLSKDTTIKPHVAWLTSENYGGVWYNTDLPGTTELDAFTFGVEFDSKMDKFNFGATAIMQAGGVDIDPAYYGVYGNHDSLDMKGYLFDIYGGMTMGPAELRAKALYASGNDENSITGDGEITAFFNPYGASHYWAEIMGFGVFDNQTSSGAPADLISNLMAFNLGTSFKVLESVKLSADLWYAELAEDDAAGNSELGTEIDLMASFTIIDNLKMDLVAAYLFAGDATYTGENDSDPYEFGTQLSLAF